MNDEGCYGQRNKTVFGPALYQSESSNYEIRQLQKVRPVHFIVDIKSVNTLIHNTHRFIYIYVYIYVYIYIYMYVCIYIERYIYIYICVCVLFIYLYISIYMLNIFKNI